VTRARIRDGSEIEIRPVAPGDIDVIEAFLEQLSLQSRAFRFFTGGASTRVAARAAVAVDQHNSYGVLAIADDHIVGHAMYGLRRPDSVEVGLEVADEWQGRGVGTAMLTELARVAVDNGFETVEAVVMSENRRMLGVFEDSGVPLEIANEPGVVHVSTRAADWAAAFH
jgi:acetate---CoA ligase (ADP-forming)